MKKWPILASLLTTILILIVFFSPASAGQPVVETFEFLDVFVVDCDGFSVEFEDNVTGRITIFFDEAGNPDTFIAHIEIRGTLTHSETGQSFRDHAVRNFKGELPFDEQSEVAAGIAFHINVPGEGVVTLVAGRIVWDASGNATFTAGPNTEIFSEQALSVICEGFADL